MAVYDGNNSYLYINGSLAGNGTPSDQIKWQGGNAAALFGKAGNATGGGAGEGDLPFAGDDDGAGAISVFRWYGRALSSGEVTINYLDGVGMPLSEKVHAYWKLDEAEGATVVADQKGNHELAVKGVTSGVAGLIGGAFSFSNDGDHLTKVLEANQTHDMFSVTLWAKAAVVNQPNYTGLFNSGSSGKDFQFDINASKFRLLGDNGRGDFGHVALDWQHLAVVHTGTAATLYLDGQRVRSFNSTDNVFQRYQIGINRGQNATFEGLIDDVGLWGYPLGDSEIAALQGLGRFSNIALDDVSIQSVLNLSEGEVVNDVGTDKHGWAYASGLEGAVGATSGSIGDGTASIVLRADGSGVRFNGKAGDVPTIVSYSQNPVVYDVGVEIALNSPNTLASPNSFALVEICQMG